MVALVAGSFAAFAALVDAESRPARRAWIAYVVLTALAVYASYVGDLARCPPSWSRSPGAGSAWRRVASRARGRARCAGCRSRCSRSPRVGPAVLDRAPEPEAREAGDPARSPRPASSRTSARPRSPGRWRSSPWRSCSSPRSCAAGAHAVGRAARRCRGWSCRWADVALVAGRAAALHASQRCSCRCPAVALLLGWLVARPRLPRLVGARGRGLSRSEWWRSRRATAPRPRTGGPPPPTSPPPSAPATAWRSTRSTRGCRSPTTRSAAGAALRRAATPDAAVAGRLPPRVAGRQPPGPADAARPPRERTTRATSRCARR